MRLSALKTMLLLLAVSAWGARCVLGGLVSSNRCVPPAPARSNWSRGAGVGGDEGESNDTTSDRLACRRGGDAKSKLAALAVSPPARSKADRAADGCTPRPHSSCIAEEVDGSWSRTCCMPPLILGVRPPDWPSLEAQASNGLAGPWACGPPRKHRPLAGGSSASKCPTSLLSRSVYSIHVWTSSSTICCSPSTNDNTLGSWHGCKTMTCDAGSWKINRPEGYDRGRDWTAASACFSVAGARPKNPGMLAQAGCCACLAHHAACPASTGGATPVMSPNDNQKQ